MQSPRCSLPTVEAPRFLRAPLTLARKAWRHPWIALGLVALLLLIAAWIAWAVHIGSKNGTDAAIGVLISWPLLFFLAANLALLVIGIRRLARGGEPGRRPAPDEPSEPAPGEGQPAPEPPSKDATTEAG
jgi:hypothetical protein